MNTTTSEKRDGPRRFDQLVRLRQLVEPAQTGLLRLAEHVVNIVLQVATTECGAVRAAVVVRDAVRRREAGVPGLLQHAQARRRQRAGPAGPEGPHEWQAGHRGPLLAEIDFAHVLRL